MNGAHPGGATAAADSATITNVADNPRQFVLGVDLDGVCADYYPFMRQVVAEWLGRDPEFAPPGRRLGDDRMGRGAR